MGGGDGDADADTDTNVESANADVDADISSDGDLELCDSECVTLDTPEHCGVCEQRWGTEGGCECQPIEGGPEDGIPSCIDDEGESCYEACEYYMILYEGECLVYGDFAYCRGFCACCTESDYACVSTSGCRLCIELREGEWQVCPR